MEYSSVFAFGLVAFGFLGMGPVTIAVDSYGPVTDNAQSIYELSLIETIPNVAKEIEKRLRLQTRLRRRQALPGRERQRGNTFKATAKPVLIGTAVVGATTMIFSLILLLRKALGIQPEMLLNLLNPYTLLGLLCGGSVIYWFTGASMQAVVHRRLPGRSVHQEAHQAGRRGQPERLDGELQGSREDLHAVCPEGDVQHLHRHLLFALAFAFLSAPVKGPNRRPSSSAT